MKKRKLLIMVLNRLNKMNEENGYFIYRYTDCIRNREVKAVIDVLDDILDKKGYEKTWRFK